jgi:hypothetical protein
LELKIEIGCLFGSVLGPAGGGRLQLIRLTGEHLPQFALFSGIQSCIDLFILNLAAKLQCVTSLIVFDSCQRLDATFPSSSNSLRHISTISYATPMH